MFTTLTALFRRSKTRPVKEIDPDEIFLDSSNLPAFDRHQFEGRLEKTISRRVIVALGAVFFVVLVLFLAKSFALEGLEGERYAAQSAQNRLRHTLIFGERGVFADRRGELLAWNAANSAEPEFSKRQYTSRAGLAHLLGFLKYPSKDSAGFYYQADFEGKDGAERYLSEAVAPDHGLKIVETDAFGRVHSESVLKKPKDGGSATLSVDARVAEKLNRLIADLRAEKGFKGGAAVMMDVENGEILALTGSPEYSPQVMTDGDNGALIASYLSDSRTPFLNRATQGLYSPGSIVKPFLALAALEEGIVTPDTRIISTGSIAVPNPYDPARPSVFKDWKAHGAVDIRSAIAFSSDVYFYEVGGGFGNQPGLGIGRIEKYLRLFGFGEEPGGNDFFGATGSIPNPQWKKANFNGDAWRLGDTYHTAIGQYGMQITPLQAVRAVAAIANGGKLLEPRLLSDGQPPSFSIIPIKPEWFALVRQGMRDAVKVGTASGLDAPFVSVAAKTGTAELGAAKKRVNSWVIGFFPFERPRYGFAVLMENGPRENTVGGLYVMRELLEWMRLNTPEYLK